MVDWKLQSCCDTQDIIFLCLYGGYSLFTMIFMNTVVVKPMKLIAIFIHEMGHASAAWLTGGSVDKIEVYQNEGGVTNFRGGFRPFIIPAGYVGVAFWGGVFVALSGSRIGATVAAGIFMAALLICLRYSPNGTLIGLCLFFFVITLAATLIDWLVFSPVLEYVTLFYGVFIGWYGIMDIWDDTISRTVEGSDASACFQMWRCCLPRCVGVQFMLCAICCQCLGLYFALVSLMNA
ncbi:peptidase M50B family protein [Nitzschia inconspicua]|uniref:Peptidase M50B family protein n=1 Tax=Nitzschia inconspicua TaxID=303405 RepID=A0A9K3LEF3_9STRA|nr:peptidase M50B family protein [Nitzschia inconspicua]